MKAIVYSEPGEFKYTDVPDPEPEVGQVLIRIKACGLCRTDMHIHRGHFLSQFPLINGHEFTGEIVELGAGVTDLRVGDRVVADNSYPCGHCTFCKAGKMLYCQNFVSQGCNTAGGFAQYVVASQDNVHVLEDLSYREAVMTEPTACAIHGMDVIALAPGSEVLVFGAGPTGIVLSQLLKLNGATHLVVAAPAGEKLDLVEKLAADDVFVVDKGDYSKHHDAIMSAYPNGFDAVVDATGVAELFKQTIDYVRMGGQLVAYGVYPEDADISINPYEIFARELTIKGSFAQTHEFARALRYLESRQVNVSDLVTDEVPLEDYGKALEMMRNREAIKIAIVP